MLESSDGQIKLCESVLWLYLYTRTLKVVNLVSHGYGTLYIVLGILCLQTYIEVRTPRTHQKELMEKASNCQANTGMLVP